VGKQSKRGRDWIRMAMPESRVIKPSKAVNRKARRESFFGRCPCGSGRVYRNCCFKGSVKEKR